MKQLLDYYPLALAEGEGAGTAYEYYVKARALKEVFAKVGTPTRLLVAGLPERYGFSLDFLLLARELGCRQVLVLDERRERLERLVEICRRLAETEKLDCSNLLEIRPQLYPEEDWPEFDLFLSCEVLQRLSQPEQQRYWQSCLQAAKAGVVFVPNAENPSHASHSKLSTVSLKQLTEQAQAAGGKIIASGYLDLPPFPPGITRSEEQREAAGEGFQRLAFKGIEQWANLERFLPLSLRRQSAHIVFVAVVR